MPSKYFIRTFLSAFSEDPIQKLIKSEFPQERLDSEDLYSKRLDTSVPLNHLLLKLLVVLTVNSIFQGLWESKTCICCWRLWSDCGCLHRRDRLSWSRWRKCNGSSFVTGHFPPVAWRAQKLSRWSRGSYWQWNGWQKSNICLASYTFLYNSGANNNPSFYFQLRVNALIKRASLHVQMDDPNRSFDDFERAAVLDPENSDVYHHRGQVLNIHLMFVS